MTLEKYRIIEPTLALFEQEGRRILGTVPAGAVIGVDRDAFHDDKLVSVTWDGQQVMLFTQDLRARARSLLTRAT